MGIRILWNVASVSNAGNVSPPRNKAAIKKSEKYFQFGINIKLTAFGHKASASKLFFYIA